MTPELEMGDNLGEIGEDVTLRRLKAERQTGEKGEGMIWIWVKCGGNSRWPVKDDFRRGCVVDVCLRCHLVSSCVWWEKIQQIQNQRREVVPFCVKNRHRFRPEIDISEGLNPWRKGGDCSSEVIPHTSKIIHLSSCEKVTSIDQKLMRNLTLRSVGCLYCKSRGDVCT